MRENWKRMNVNISIQWMKSNRAEAARWCGSLLIVQPPVIELNAVDIIQEEIDVVSFYAFLQWTLFAFTILAFWI